VIRANVPQARVGITLNFEMNLPASPSAADHDAARHGDGAFNRWFLDPVFGRRYPADIVADYEAGGRLPGGALKAVRPDDYAIMSVPTDFLGVNYYTRQVVRSQTVQESQNLPVTLVRSPEAERTTMGWDVYPQGLHDLLCRLHFEYGPSAMYVTENGSAFVDVPDPNGRVEDPRRLAYLRDHLAAARRAIDAGVPLKGYFGWSLLDNFEWERGYTQRFGLVRVDYDTQVRTPKASAEYYARVIRERRVLDA